MYLPLLQPALDSDIYVRGDVAIHPSAAIAPGTILQAAPNNRIVIGEGVCVGMGVILNACGGSIEIENGAILGAGVLIFGKSKIGCNACIGNSTTIFNASVEAKTIVPSGSLIGDTSRQIATKSQEETNEPVQPSNELEEVIESPWNEPTLESEETIAEIESDSIPELTVEVTANNLEDSNSLKSTKTPVAGQIYINKLLLTIFPQRQSRDRDRNKDG
jgi:carbon dioxide concentrating mechanism protein CcmN